LQFQLRNQAEDEKNMSKNKSVLGIYSSRIGVENAISVLKDSGFAHTDLSVLLPENLGSKELATEKGTKAPEGATAGAGSGAVVGGMLGWLVGIGALAIPGLAGAGVGGAMGGVTRALVGLGIPEYEARRYEGRLQKGGILVSVHCDTSAQIKRAKEIMERTGAEDISSAGEASTDGKTNDTPSAKRAGTGY
jgi:hypothetical protein